MKRSRNNIKCSKQVCELCDKKRGRLFRVKKFTADGKILRDSLLACVFCKDGFLKRLNYH